jgi:hypothetical protein
MKTICHTYTLVMCLLINVNLIKADNIHDTILIDTGNIICANEELVLLQTDANSVMEMYGIGSVIGKFFKWIVSPVLRDWGRYREGASLKETPYTTFDRDYNWEKVTQIRNMIIADTVIYRELWKRIYLEGNKSTAAAFYGK